MKADDILKLVSDETGISIEDICLPDYIPGSSKMEVVAARKLAVKLLKVHGTKVVPEHEKKLTLAEIGEVVGRARYSGHCSVIYCCQSVDDMLATNPKYRRKFEEIENKLKSLFIK